MQLASVELRLAQYDKAFEHLKLLKETGKIPPPVAIKVRFDARSVQIR